MKSEITETDIVLEKIKKEYSEEMKKMCKRCFPSLLESNPSLLFDVLKKTFPSKEIANDILFYDAEKAFKLYVKGKIKKYQIEEEIEIEKSPEELLKERGYTLIECHTKEEIQKFRKYYVPGEELCTFNDEDRIEKCHVFFAVKENAEELKREDYVFPERQDEYGTSVLSIQFDKDESNAISIKNRYNHSVKNPDATFSNDLDNIIPGLTKSFEKFKGLKEKNVEGKFQNDNFIEIVDEQTKETKIFCCNVRNSKFAYCTGGYIIDLVNNKIIDIYTDSNRYIFADNFIIDLHSKKIISHGINYEDDLLRIEENIKSILVEKDIIKKRKIKTDKETGLPRELEYDEAVGKKITILHADGTTSILKLDFSNCLVGYENESLEIINDNFLSECKRLKEVKLPNVTKVGNDAMVFYNGTEISLPNVKIIGNDFMGESDNVRNINMPKLEETGMYFIRKYFGINVDLPSLKKVRASFLEEANNVKKINMPNIEKISSGFIRYYIGEEINLPKVRNIGNSFLNAARNISRVYLPEVRTIGNNCMTIENKVQALELPKVELIGRDFMRFNDEMKILYLPNVTKIEKGFMEKNTTLLETFYPNLVEVGYCFLKDNELFRRDPSFNNELSKK